MENNEENYCPKCGQYFTDIANINAIAGTGKCQNCYYED